MKTKTRNHGLKNLRVRRFAKNVRNWDDRRLNNACGGFEALLEDARAQAVAARAAF